MSKKTFMATVGSLAVIILLICQASTMGTVRANPWLSIPDQETPVLAIKYPENNTSINTNNVLLNFSITKPISWNECYMFWHYVGDIISTDIYLDQNPVANYDMRNSSSFTSFSVGLSELSLGIHTINVTIMSLTYYAGAPYGNSSVDVGIRANGWRVMGFPIVVSDIINFTVDSTITSQAPTLTPSPSFAPSLTPLQTPSPTPTISPIITPSPSPTQQPIAEPTAEPSITASPESIIDDLSGAFLIRDFIVLVVVICLVAITYAALKLRSKNRIKQKFSPS